ncbi:MAG: hypothetical protein AB1505_37070, partial [Candidatus Latescibacterota bacterium]
MAVQTYQVLAKSDELMHALADTLIRRLGATEPDLLTHLAGPDPSPEGLGYGLSQGLQVELVKATEKAKSPLLVLRYASSNERLPVLVVNTWSELFLKRHQGLSTNVTEDFYQRVQAQYQVTKDNLEAAEQRLSALQAGYHELKTAKTEMGLKSAKLDASLQAYQQALTELEDKQRQLAQADAVIAGLEHEGEWIGYLPAAEVASLPEPAGAPPMRADLVRLLRGIARLQQDSLTVAQEHQRRQQVFDGDVEERLLSFERDRGIARVRSLGHQLDSTVAQYRAELAGSEQSLADVETKLAARREELEQQPPVLVVAKAVTDDQVWAQVNRKGKVEPEAQKGLGDFRLQTEVLNPVHGKLAAEVSDLEVQRSLLLKRREFLEGDIPRLQEQLLQVGHRLDPLEVAETAVHQEIDSARVALARELQRREDPVLGALARQRASLEGHRAYYRAQKEQQELLRRELAGLRQDVAYQEESFQAWGGDVRAVAATVDSLDLERTRLERNIEVYKQTFQRFARLQEEARIAREQAAGDIQVVSRATLARVAGRGTLSKGVAASLLGLMTSALVAFVISYTRRMRAGSRWHRATGCRRSRARR